MECLKTHSDPLMQVSNDIYTVAAYFMIVYNTTNIIFDQAIRVHSVVIVGWCLVLLRHSPIHHSPEYHLYCYLIAVGGIRTSSLQHFTELII